MTLLWPQIPAPVAERLLASLPAEGPTHGATRNRDQIYTPVGGTRPTDADVAALTTTIEDVARRHGFPQRQPNAIRVAFDRDAATTIRAALDLSWSEAGQRGIWSFISLVALPHVTYWRFGINNPERWIATDLTRHAWARLWWQAVVFETDPAILLELTESDLNQLMERRTLGGDTRITCALARAIVERTPAGGVSRRNVIRDATARLRRRLEFIDTAAVGDDDLAIMCRSEVDASWQRVRSVRSGHSDATTNASGVQQGAVRPTQ